MELDQLRERFDPNDFQDTIIGVVILDPKPRVGLARVDVPKRLTPDGKEVADITIIQDPRKSKLGQKLSILSRWLIGGGWVNRQYFVQGLSLEELKLRYDDAEQVRNRTIRRAKIWALV